MPQKLKGLFTILCPSCRERAPVLTDGRLEWRCLHRQTIVRETSSHLLLTLGKHSSPLYLLDDSSHKGDGIHVTK